MRCRIFAPNLWASPLLLAVPAMAADADVSGKYEDVAGDPITIAQSGSALVVSPDMSDMPEQARQYLGDIALEGRLEDRGDQAFSMNAKYEKTIEPVPSMKLKMKISFAAEGKQIAQGLVMESCNWEAHMLIFAEGEIAGSENMSEKCVGLWKKQD